MCGAARQQHEWERPAGTYSSMYPPDAVQNETFVRVWNVDVTVTLLIAQIQLTHLRVHVQARLLDNHLGINGLTCTMATAQFEHETHGTSKNPKKTSGGSFAR